MENDSVYNILPPQAMLTENELSVMKCVDLFEGGAENIYLVDEQGGYRWRAIQKRNFRLDKDMRGNWVIPIDALAPVVFDLPITEKTVDQLRQACFPVLERDINMAELPIVKSDGKVVALARLALTGTSDPPDWDKLPEAYQDIKRNEGLARKIYISSLEHPMLAKFVDYWRGRLEMELLSEANWQRVLFGQADGVLLYANDIFPDCPKISVEELYRQLRHIQMKRVPPYAEAIQEILSRMDSLQKNMGNLQKLSELKSLLPQEGYTDRARKNDTERYLADYKTMAERGEEFKKEILALLEGLDSESRSVICLILARLMALAKGEPIRYTAEENRLVEKLRRDYWPQVKQIGQGIFGCYSYVLPVNHFEAIVFHYEHGLGNLRHLDRLSGKCVLDAGGYVGDSALIIRKYVKKGTIYSFEAKAENCERIPLTMTWNGLCDVVPINKALGEREEEVSFYVSRSPGRSEACSSMVIDGYCLHEEETMECKVPCTTVDAFVRENKLEVGLIKVDVEGAEQMLLRGAEHTLREQRPALCIAIYHNMDDFMHIKPWLENLGLGYRFRIFRPVLEPSFMVETVLLAEIDGTQSEV